MPRPGPRPYECVRRAWHSDRHQPMRGSIIQQIFRVVNDAHSSATRKNREWQEKLPTVVLKAEEIMYSKANSEAEYMEHDTLWDRLTDAIDTIIRRDESGESGEYLQPCIEAALILGCTPVRASRSQRYCNPTTYLTPKVQEQQTSVAPVVSDMSNAVRPPPQQPDPSGSQLGTLRPAMGNHANSAPKFVNLVNQNYGHIAAHNPPFFHTHYPPTMVSSEPIESKRSFKLGSVYPLYYGTQLHKIEPQFSLPLQQNLNPNNVIIGRPVGWTVTEPSRSGTTKNLFPSESAEHASLRSQQENLVSTAVEVSEADCDLSLRLGPVLDPHVSYETEHGASQHCQVDKKFPMPSSSNHEFCFFPRQNADGISHSQSGKWAFRGDVQHVNATMRKRKTTFHHDAEDGCTLWQPELRTNNIGQTRGRGL